MRKHVMWLLVCSGLAAIMVVQVGTAPRAATPPTTTQLQGLITNMQGQIKDLQKTVTDLQTQVNAMATQVEALQALKVQVTDTQRDLKGTQDQFAALQAQFAAHTHTVNVPNFFSGCGNMGLGYMMITPANPSEAIRVYTATDPVPCPSGVTSSETSPVQTSTPTPAN